MRDTILESWLNDQSVKWVYLDAVDVAKIAVDDEARRQIRLTTALDNERVLSYGIALENGDKFPAIAVFGKADAKLFPIASGLHRLAAFELVERKRTDVYAIDSSDKIVMDRIRRTINQINGLPVREDERMIHAVHLHRGDGYTIKDAARAANVPYAKLRDRLAAEQAEEALAPYGIDARQNKLTQTFLKELLTIRSDKHKADFTKLSLEARLTSADIGELRREIVNCKTDKDVEVVLAEWRERYRDVIAQSRSGKLRPPTSPLRSIPGYRKKIEDAWHKGKSTAAMWDEPQVLKLIEELKLIASTAINSAHELEKLLKGRKHERQTNVPAFVGHSALS